VSGRDIRRFGRGCILLGLLAVVAQPAAAHTGALGGTLTSVPIPFWLVVLTGGGIIGASFLFTSFATDHEFIQEINDSGLAVPSPDTVVRLVVAAARTVGVAVLGVLVVVGLTGPPDPTKNLAVLAIWAGWWAGYTATVYLVGNTWGVVNPWRALSSHLPRFAHRDWPTRWSGWPAALGLLGLVWLEVVAPVATVPSLLAGIVLAYSVVTLAGAGVYGDVWFREVDPVSRVFRTYGWIAPLRWTDDGLSVSLPGSSLVSRLDEATDGDVVFVVALLWVTSYDGLVSTAAHASFVRGAVDLGIPPLAVYLASALSGFVVFLGVYRRAAAWARRTAGSYVAAEVIERRFVCSLVPIAAGYHLAHFLGYYLTFSPSLLTVATAPFDPPAVVPYAVLPGWFGGLQLAFVVLGHLLAIWVAHAIAFETFTGRLQPIRSQYPFALVMVFYTMISMWLVAQPYTPPPFL
jgi:hypothetical protein